MSERSRRRGLSAEEAEAAFRGYQADEDPLPRIAPWRASDADLAWWRDARFGLMLHFGVAAVEGVELSWGRELPRPFDIQGVPMRDGRPAHLISQEQYDALYRRFAPHRFDAADIVAAALEMGAGYLVVTAKHHDGFCMWDTRESDYRITSLESPFGRDVVGELAAACHEARLPFGIYYSQRDWHHPEYLRGDNAEYRRYMFAQLRELLTGYGRVDLLWFDSYGDSDLMADWDPLEMIRLVKRLQPQVIMNNRLAVLGDYNQGPPEVWGDFDTPEQRMGELQTDRPWESCVTLAGSQWGWMRDAELLSRDELIRLLAGCAVRDGNLLLNVGPSDLGEIDAAQRERVREVGSWLERYGESIRGTRACPLVGASWGGATVSDEALYLHVFDWPDDGIHVELPFAVRTDAIVLTGGEVEVAMAAHGVDLAWRSGDRDPVDTIVRLPRA